MKPVSRKTLDSKAGKKWYLVERKITVKYKHYTWANNKAHAIDLANDHGENTNAGTSCVADTVKATIERVFVVDYETFEEYERKIAQIAYP
jgi:hypothetical protein